MKEETKIFISIIVVILLIFGGIIWYSKSSSSPADAGLLIRPDSQKIEAPEAKVVVVEFGDYQCPACGTAHPLVKQVLQDYRGKVTFVFRNFPLPQHQYAIIAAEAAEIAGDQGKFWEMYDILFEHQDEWVNSKSPKDLFARYAKNIGMNVDEFVKSLDNNKYSDKIQRDKNDGGSLSVNATPTFFVNGEKLLLNYSGSLKNAIDKALK